MSSVPTIPPNANLAVYWIMHLLNLLSAEMPGGYRRDRQFVSHAMLNMGDAHKRHGLVQTSNAYFPAISSASGRNSFRYFLDRMDRFRSSSEYGGVHLDEELENILASWPTPPNRNVGAARAGYTRPYEAHKDGRDEGYAKRFVFDLAQGDTADRDVKTLGVAA